MVSDPIYGYVYFNTEVEEPIINSVLLQRLRYIMQLQTAHYVYPGAVHTRFQHSLGVMHLSGLMAEDIVNKAILLYGMDILDGYNTETVVEAARIAGLLHDVGHAAFGHAFEQAILWKKNVPREVANHEKIGYLLVKTVLEDLIEKAEKYLPGIKELLHQVLGETSSTVKGIVKLLRWVVKEGYYPADVLDFLRRDSYYAGTSEYGSIMYERLYKNTYPLRVGNDFEIVLDRIAVGEFRQYMRARASMYEHVYYHSVCRAFDRVLYEIIDMLDNELDLTGRVLALVKGDVVGYLELTDAYMYSIMMSKALRDNTRLGYLCRKLIIERKPEWKRAGREVSLSAYKGSEALGKALKLVLDSEYRKAVSEDIHERLAASLKHYGLSVDEIWLDVLDIAPLPRVTIYPSEVSSKTPLVLYTGKKSGRKIVVSEELDIVTEELPLEVIFRVYVLRNKYSVELETPVTRALLEALKEVLEIDVLKVSNYIRSIYAAYSNKDYYKVRLTV